MDVNIFNKTGIFPSQAIRASYYQNFNEDRSESSIAVNPQNSDNLIGDRKSTRLNSSH